MTNRFVRSLYLDIKRKRSMGRFAVWRKTRFSTRALEQVFSLPFASPSAMVYPTSVLPTSNETLAVAQEHHRTLIDAISRRQGARAESIAREHALVSLRVLDLALSNANALSRVPGKSLIKVAAMHGQVSYLIPGTESSPESGRGRRR
jgi:DNA-binding GntR family transcriptional regulator